MNLKKLKDFYDSLDRRGKVIVAFVGAVALLGLLELLTGCASSTLSKTWSF